MEDVRFRRYLGVLRLATKLDPLLTTSQRSAVVERPEIAGESADIPYEVSVVRVVGEVRRAIESRGDLFRVGIAGSAEDLCYVAVDSSFTAPAIELVGGYLGIV